MRRPETIARRGRTYRLAKAAVKWGLFLTVACFVVRAIARRLADPSWSWDQIDFQWGFLAGGLVCSLAAGVPPVVAFRFLLASSCEPPGWRTMCGVTWVARVGKYVPGKAASVVGAVWMLTRRGVAPAAATGAVFARMGIVTLVSLVIAAPITLWRPVRHALPAAWFGCLLLVACGAILLHPKVFMGVHNLFFRLPVGRRWDKPLRLRDYAIPVAAGAGQWLLVGLALLLVTRSVSPVPIGDVPLFIPAAALASSLGFLAVFAPAGLGVQDGVLLLILSSLVGANVAAVAVVLMRLVQTASDALLALIGLVLTSGTNKKAVDD